MALGDIKIKDQVAAPGGFGATLFNVAAGATAINAGEPVVVSGLGAAQTVTAMATNKPVVATDFVAGIAQTTSTQTASVAGSVNVILPDEKMVWLIAPKVAATFNTQAKYDALVGSRVLLDLTTGVYTILAADSATSGCVIRPLDMTRYLGLVAFSFRAGSSYLA